MRLFRGILLPFYSGRQPTILFSGAAGERPGHAGELIGLGTSPFSVIGWIRNGAGGRCGSILTVATGISLARTVVGTVRMPFVFPAGTLMGQGPLGT